MKDQYTPIFDILKPSKGDIHNALESLKKVKRAKNTGYLLVYTDCEMASLLSRPELRVYSTDPFIQLLGKNSGETEIYGGQITAKINMCAEGIPRNAVYHPATRALYVTLSPTEICRIRARNKKRVRRLPEGDHIQTFRYRNTLYALSTDLNELVKIMDFPLLGPFAVKQIKIKNLPEGYKAPLWVAVSPEGAVYLHYTTECSEYHIAPFNIETGELKPEKVIYSGSCSDDCEEPAQSEVIGKTLITSGSGRSLEFVNLETGEKREVLEISEQFMARIDGFAVVPVKRFGYLKGYIIFVGTFYVDEPYIAVIETTSKFQVRWKIIVKVKESMNLPGLRILGYLTPSQYRVLGGK